LSSTTAPTPRNATLVTSSTKATSASFALETPAARTTNGEVSVTIGPTTKLVDETVAQHVVTLRFETELGPDDIVWEQLITEFAQANGITVTSFNVYKGSIIVEVGVANASQAETLSTLAAEGDACIHAEAQGKLCPTLHATTGARVTQPTEGATCKDLLAGGCPTTWFPCCPGGDGVVLGDVDFCGVENCQPGLPCHGGAMAMNCPKLCGVCGSNPTHTKGINTAHTLRDANTASSTPPVSTRSTNAATADKPAGEHDWVDKHLFKILTAVIGLFCLSGELALIYS